MELEALFQAVGLWQLLDDGAMGLPSEARSVQIHALPGRAETLECFVERNTEVPGFEALLRDEAGRVYLQISGYQTAMLPS